MWDRYRALMARVMLDAIIEYKTYCKSKNPPRGFRSAVGHILNDENWLMLDIQMTGMDAMKIINNKSLKELKAYMGYPDEDIDFRPIVATNIFTGEIHHYKSTRSAEKNLYNYSVQRSGIREVLRGHQKSTKGWTFKFEEENNGVAKTVRASKKGA